MFNALKYTEVLEKAELRQEIKDVRYEVRELESRLTIKLGPMLVLALGAMTAITKLV